MTKPSHKSLKQALNDAGAAHHDYEQVVLGGERDEQWPAFYAAYVLGRVGDFAPASSVSRWLQSAPAEADWADSAAAFVLSKFGD